MCAFCHVSTQQSFALVCMNGVCTHDYYYAFYIFKNDDLTFSRTASQTSQVAHNTDNIRIPRTISRRLRSARESRARCRDDRDCLSFVSVSVWWGFLFLFNTHTHTRMVYFARATVVCVIIASTWDPHHRTTAMTTTTTTTDVEAKRIYVCLAAHICVFIVLLVRSNRAHQPELRIGWDSDDLMAKILLECVLCWHIEVLCFCGWGFSGRRWSRKRGGWKRAYSWCVCVYV